MQFMSMDKWNFHLTFLKEKPKQLNVAISNKHLTQVNPMQRYMKKENQISKNWSEISKCKYLA